LGNVKEVLSVPAQLQENPSPQIGAVGMGRNMVKGGWKPKGSDGGI
jgi:hypothetical protein